MKIIWMFLVLILACGCAMAKPQLRLAAGAIDPASTPTPQKSESDARGNRYYVLQFKGPVMDAWKKQAANAGAELLDYLPDFAFIIRANPASEAKLRALPFVEWVGDYAPKYRISPLKPRDGDLNYVIRMFPGADSSTIYKNVVSSGGAIVSGTQGKSRVVRARLSKSKLLNVALSPGVAWIEPWNERKISIDIARGITAISDAWTDLGLYGAGRKVAIADTGLDNGRNDSTLSADFRGRVIKTYALGRPSDWSDKNGHGTHVAGALVGNGSLSGGNPATHSYIGSFAGVAPEALLIFQSVGDNGSGLPGIPQDLNLLFSPAYSDGARVHSDSWGSTSNGAYDSDSYNTDLFLWNHKDMVICVAAGNEGVDKKPTDGFVDSGSVDAPGTAKNCITVGASESVTTLGRAKSWGNYWSSDFPMNPIWSDPISDNPAGMAAWSSRGPTSDGRIKPDICAPGTNIISARSHAFGAGSLWGVYNADYVFSGGTSMATPIVAGACALVQEYYALNNQNASAALVKATLLNGAWDMTPGQYLSPQEIPVRPNSVEGWGRLDLRNSILPPSPKMVLPFDISPGLSTGESSAHTFYLAGSSVPLRVTLVWTDYPGSTLADIQLVNDLDLSLQDPLGTVYNGNNAIDRLNNVEGIDILNPMPGFYSVTVNAHNIPFGPQPYALIISGSVLTDQPVGAPSIASAKSHPDGTMVSLQSRIVSAGTYDFRDRFYIQDPDRTSGIRVDYGQAGGPSLLIGDTVRVVGRLDTVNGERTIVDPLVNP